MRTTDVLACYVCGASGTPVYEGLVDAIVGVSGSWRVSRCDACGLMWLRNRPDGSAVDEIYREYYTHSDKNRRLPRLLYTAFGVLRGVILAGEFGYETTRTPLGRHAGWLLARDRLLRDVVGGEVAWLDGPADGRLLDVGCGNGTFLASMRGLGWNVTGVELDARAASHARGLGIEVHVGTVETAALPSDSFDGIVLNHVIEHLVDPVRTLTELRRILKPGGRLVVATPNVAGLGHALFRSHWRGLEPPRHFIIFSPATLARCARDARLTVTEQRSSARAAHYFFYASAMIRKNRHLDRTGLGGPTPFMLALSFLFQGTEQVCRRFWPAGDEAVIVATKSGST